MKVKICPDKKMKLKYSLKIGGDEVGEVDLMTGGIECSVVKLDRIPLEMLDHFFHAPET